MLDKIDKHILKILRQDGRMSWVKLAKLVNLSPSACQRRVEALQESGLIKRFTLDILPEKAGLQIQSFINLKVERQRVDTAKALLATIGSYPEVRALYKLSGRVDYLINAAFADISALSDFIDRKLLALDGVVDASSSIVLGDYPTSFEIR